MNIDDILEMLDDLLDKAPTVPFRVKRLSLKVIKSAT